MLTTGRHWGRRRRQGLCLSWQNYDVNLRVMKGPPRRTPRGAPGCGRGGPHEGRTRPYGSRFLRRAGQSLASPGRWNPEDRKYPESERWTGVVELFRKYAETHTSAQLLVELSLGKVSLQVAIHFRVDLRAQERSHQARTIVWTETTQS